MQPLIKEDWQGKKRKKPAQKTGMGTRRRNLRMPINNPAPLWQFFFFPKTIAESRTGERRALTHLQAICLQARGMAHSMMVKAQAARQEKRQR